MSRTPTSVSIPAGSPHPGSTCERPVVLVCDADREQVAALADRLGANGFEPVCALDPDSCLDQLRVRAPEILVLDVSSPLTGGLTTLRRLRELGSEVPVVALSAADDVQGAILATRLGARTLLSRPADPAQVALAVSRVLAEERSRRGAELPSRDAYGELVGRAPALGPLLADLRRLESVSASTVLVLGESGSGKDVVARTIHARGPRRVGRFVEVDCSTLPHHLAESELFGHEKGAFTDAQAAKQGLFEVAAGGTVFLDEIGELPLALQAKLLRALENRTFRRVGGTTPLRLDATVIAATNRDLKRWVAEGRFREDLLFRLDVVTLRVPPLRQRREDVPLLAAHFLARFEKDLGRKLDGVTPEAMALLQAWSWPGNVRELKNVLERVALLTAEVRPVGVADLPPELRVPARPSPPARSEPPPLVAEGADDAREGDEEFPFRLPEGGVHLDQVERGLVIQALRRTGGQQTAAARMLGITRFQLRTRIEKYGIEVRPSTPPKSED